MKATFHAKPTDFNEFRQSLAVALQHSGRCKQTDAARAAYHLADTDDMSGRQAIEAAYSAWDNISLATLADKKNVEEQGFWGAFHDLIHDVLCDADLAADWNDANQFATFCEEHRDGSSHNF